LTKDPELRSTTSGKNVCTFSVAVQKQSKPKDGSSDADFFNVQAWDKTAEYVANYLRKGRLIAITGRLSSRKYTTSEGQSREVVEVIATSVNSLERPKESQGSEATRHGMDADDYDPFAD
jgi:single-strand DNA-binding protein